MTAATKESAARRRANRRLFVWLDQVKADELPPSAFLIAFEIGQRFNHKHGGAAWPSIKTLATATGLSEPSVVRLTRLLAQRGHLRIDPGKAGRGYSNCYFMVLQKGAEAHHKRRGKTSTDGGFAAAQKTSTGETKTSASGVDLPKPTYGDPRGSPIGRESDVSLTLNDAPTGARRHEGGAPEGEEQKADGFAELLAIWQRPFLDDEAAARRAYATARRDTDHETIMTGARLWVAAFDNPRFLPKLADWLAACGWLKLPPQRRQQRSKGKNPDLASEMLKAGRAT